MNSIYISSKIKTKQIKNKKLKEKEIISKPLIILDWNKHILDL
jgi:hypothetical protein